MVGEVEKGSLLLGFLEWMMYNAHCRCNRMLSVKSNVFSRFFGKMKNWPLRFILS
jgi:hypothetical protein